MKPCLVFQSDFTYKEGAVAAMYGVVKLVDPSLEILDLTHEIPQYDIWSASFRLHQVLPFWPKGTIFVSVVDPGVGTARKACVALTQSGHLIVSPDNGTLTHIAKFIGLKEVREINPEHRFNSPYKTSVFNGRDIFGYVGALLASGQLKLEQVGPLYGDFKALEIPDPKCEENKLKGILEIQDPNFGNVWTNIPIRYADDLDFKVKDKIHCEIFHKGQLKLKQSCIYGATFGEVDLYQPILYCNELECLALALNQDSYAQTYNVGQGPDWTIVLSQESYV